MAMTLQLLHEEYRQSTGATSYSYTQFCRDYRKFVASRKLVMRQTTWLLTPMMRLLS